MLGIDLSHHQPPSQIDWDTLASQIDFVIARATYGTRQDATFQAHVSAARDHGLKVGGYHFFRQRQDQWAQLGAFVDACGKAGIGPGDIAPTVDLEWNENYDGDIDPDAHNSRGREIVDHLVFYYGECMVYLSPAFWELLGRPRWIIDRPLWLSKWSDKAPQMPHHIWQYTSTGRLDGFDGPLDLNRADSLPLIPVDSLRV